ncbi:serine hydrolase domain-containing protein [Aquirufa rosea]|uniref:Class C beta-lactamase-related serine hydrolase n=1 Tax=Aquirufa rosea TaxID=2509241 RepID=A0A4Q1C0N7_9BACT|nr:serine hydrolase [Aquirufa rosea]RXK50677.1 class C beta-lactamase-related serine hydrolase [Aquirufa rosea]
MKTTKIIFSLLALLFSTSLSIAQSSDKLVAGMSMERLKRYEAFLQKEIDTKQIPGAVSMIVKDAKIIEHRALGYSNAVDKIPMKTDDLFYMQSMTKPIISVAFMMLFEEGHFLLTDPVSKYIPEFKNMRVAKDIHQGANGETDSLNSQITIAQLLSHTSGMTHGLATTALDRDFRMKYYGLPFPKNIQELVIKATKIPLVGQPGKQWNYSASPDVLSALIEKFSGMSTNDFLQERLFKPLGMTNTAYNLTDAQAARVVKVHRNAPSGELVLNSNQPKTSGNTIWFGTHSLFSTAKDYMEFCQMLLNEGKWKGKQYLSKKTLELMVSNQVGDMYEKRIPDRQGEGFGLGFAVLESVASSQMLGDKGLFFWSGANNTHFFINPKEKLIAIMLTQKDPHTIYYHTKMRQLIHQAIVE